MPKVADAVGACLLPTLGGTCRRRRYVRKRIPGAFFPHDSLDPVRHVSYLLGVRAMEPGTTKTETTMYTNEIATRLIAAITPDNDRSGFAESLGYEYILIRDTQAGAYLVTADDAARFLADDDTGYDSFCSHCDPVRDESTAFLAWGEYDVHVTDGHDYILDANTRAALDAGETVWEVMSADDQAHVGYYAGDDADDAVRAMLDDAGSDDDLSLYRAIWMAG